MPAKAELPERLEAVLRVVYLVFNEGYSATAGESVTRAELSQEAIRLGRLLVELLPEPEAMGLLALMLLQESRRAARSRPDGEIVLLEDQDRGLWDRALDRRRGRAHHAGASHAHVRALLPAGGDRRGARRGAEHGRRPTGARSSGCTTRSRGSMPSPVIALNRAVAVAMRDGPAAGLALVDALMRDLEGYHLAHAARADLCRRLGRKQEAIAAYGKALALSRQGPERRFLERRIAELQK